MAEKYSTGLRNWLLAGKDIREAFDDFIIKVFGGTVPADADADEIGTLLCTITKDGAEVTATERSVAKQATIDITVAGLAATIIVAINGTDYTYVVTAEDDNLLKVARKVALMLEGIPEIHAIGHATASGDGKVAVKSAIAGLSFTIAKGGGGGGGTATWTVTDNTIANVRSDALQWGAASNATMNKETSTWEGVNVATGTATHFRIVRPDDTGVSSTVERRIQGSVGTSGAELNLNSINLAKDATLTIGTGQMTMPVG